MNGSLRWFSIALAALLLAVGFTSPLPIHASSPCDTTGGPPRGPGSDPVPTIAGSVTAHGTSDVEDATVKLFRCDLSGPTHVATELTDASGEFEFGSLTGPSWYYIEVQMSGPLNGHTASTGTSNPTAAYDVGPGQTGLALDFED